MRPRSPALPVTLLALALVAPAAAGPAAAGPAAAGPAGPAGPVAAARRPAAPPPELLARVTRPPIASFDGLRDFANALKPGIGMILSDGMIDQALAGAATVGSLDALDHGVASHVLYVEDGGTSGAVVVGKLRDGEAPDPGEGAAVTRDGWVVLGPRPLVDKVGAWALATLPAAQVGGLAATVYLPAVLARHAGELAALRGQLAAAGALGGGALAGTMEGYADGLIGALRDCDQVVVTVAGARAQGELDVGLVPRRGTKLARFVAAQRPSAYPLVDRLPAGAGGVVIGGRLVAGPYRAGLLELTSRMFGATLPADVVQGMAAMMQASSGELAMSLAMKPGAPMAGVELFGVSDPTGFAGALAKILASYEQGRVVDAAGVKATMTSAGPGETRGGVLVRRIDTTYDLSSAPAATRDALAAALDHGAMHTHLAVVDKTAAVAFGGRSAELVDQAVALARGGQGGGAGPAVRALLDASRGRRESLAMALDLGAVAGLGRAGQPLLVALGFTGGAMHLHVTLPAATLRGAMP